MKFIEFLENCVTRQDSLLCVGLDSELGKIPEKYKTSSAPQYDFNQSIIEKTHDLVCSYKLNTAFYEARGVQGIDELKKTCDYLKEKYPEIPIILDAKRGDISNTNLGYAQFAFDYLGADAITLQPYLGGEDLKPFLSRTDKGCIILCRTSNPGAAEFQDLNTSGDPLYLRVARTVSEKWNTNNNCLLVAGATYPEEIKNIRSVAQSMTFLVPGVGVQGADLENTLRAALRPDGKGAIIAVSRSIIFSENPRLEAEKLRNEINRYRQL